MVDWIPGISQIKSAVQFIAGDSDGARQTQINFVRQCPVISQCTALVQAAAGDDEGARETLRQGGSVINSAINSIPVVGHVKGAVHYMVGDRNGGDDAMKASSHTTGVLLYGVVGGALGGPAGAIAGGITGGAVADGYITAIDSAVHNESRLYGVANHINKITDGKMTAGDVVDIATSTICDGLTGLAGAKAFDSLPKKNSTMSTPNHKTTKHAASSGRKSFKGSTSRSKPSQTGKANASTTGNAKASSTASGSPDFSVVSNERPSVSDCVVLGATVGITGEMLASEVGAFWNANAQSEHSHFGDDDKFKRSSEPNDSDSRNDAKFERTSQPNDSKSGNDTKFKKTSQPNDSNSGNNKKIKKTSQPNDSNSENDNNFLQTSRTNDSNYATQQDLKLPNSKDHKVRCITDLQRGTHIEMKRTGYSHHAIVTRVNPESNTYEVIHFSSSEEPTQSLLNGKAIVKREVLPFDPDNLYWREYEQRLSNEDAVKRAERIFSLSDDAKIKIYNLLKNNCEHLITYCVTGVHHSAQVEDAKTLALLLAPAVIPATINNMLERESKEKK